MERFEQSTVCKGTGNRQIPIFNTRDLSNQQGKKFADELCKNMGFRSAEFLGPRDNYYKFTRKRKFEVPQLSVACKTAMPEYAIAGYEPCESDCQGWKFLNRKFFNFSVKK